MFSIKLREISILILYAVVFMEANYNINIYSYSKTAIINSICQYDGWRQLTYIDGVHYRSLYYKLDDIFTTVTRNMTKKKIRAAVLILGCAYAYDLKKIFIMVKEYSDICQKTLIQKDNTYECTTDLLKITKKITLLATVMKGALIALDVIYRTSSNDSTYDYILYHYLSHLQKVENDIVHFPQSQDKLLNDRIILSKINCVFNREKRNIKSETINKFKECKFNQNISDSILQELKTLTYQIPQNEKKFEYLNKNINDEIEKIVTEKFYNLGFYFNIDIQMIDVRVPDENVNNRRMKERQLYQSYFIRLEKNKTATEVEELMEFLLEVLVSKENINDKKLIDQNSINNEID
ncbi:uncharacterized protein LOC126906822 isoform X3 [Daktulosphaira vitifoliae]|uniref:uncharacterized protein LOC126906822 isoform X2 n=1 Tax=Daktulosphaira vitifoliae TaxID=58002 RepID=UPI0021A9C40D|nr:uncharacterized protein LOC126906822 isoform X2 [Daktulosphaira vitifoliae]XP_050543660.1 uncharacterized protein LOC126906822 isoform X3 [Daktulosphaira vitifoliae]